MLLIVTLDTSILRYFDTLIRSMPRLDLVVYDNTLGNKRGLTFGEINSIQGNNTELSKAKKKKKK